MGSPKVRALKPGLMEGNTTACGRLENLQEQARRSTQMEESKAAIGTKVNSWKVVSNFPQFLFSLEPPEGFVQDAGAPESGSGQNDVDDKVNLENKYTAGLMHNLQ